MTHDLDTAREIFRLAVLAAMDEAAERIFGEGRLEGQAGKISWKGKLGALDVDLPAVFPTLDAQLLRLADRYNHQLIEDYIGTPRWCQERAELQALGIALADDEAVV